jgi:hypothetical protein
MFQPDRAYRAASGVAEPGKFLPAQGVIDMAGVLRVPRSRGALSGMLLILLGAWGGLIPFIGPYFHYAYTPATTWTYSSGRMWLEVLPGAVTLVGGLIVLASRSRPLAVAGGWLAALGGGWFAVGGVLAPLWMRDGTAAAGTPVGGTAVRIAEQIGFFAGLSVAIVFMAALAIGRLTVVGVRDAQLAERAAASRDTAAASRAAAARDDEVSDGQPGTRVGTAAPNATSAGAERVTAAPDTAAPDTAAPDTAGGSTTRAQADQETDQAKPSRPAATVR